MQAAERAGSALALIVFGGLVTAASAGVLAFALRTRRRPSASLSTISFGALPIAATAQSVLCWWEVGPMPGDEAAGGWALALGGLMRVAVAAQCVIVARQGTLRQRTARQGTLR